MFEGPDETERRQLDLAPDVWNNRWPRSWRADRSCKRRGTVHQNRSPPQSPCSADVPCQPSPWRSSRAAGAAARLAIEQVEASNADGDTPVLVLLGPVTLFPHGFRSLKFDKEMHFVSVTRRRQRAVDRPCRPGQGPGCICCPCLDRRRQASVARAIGAPKTHVPDRGSAPAMTELAGGQIAAVPSPVTEALALHAAGKVRIVATAGAMRSPCLQGVPMLKESGIDIDVPVWFAPYAPAATPAATLTRLRTAVGAGAGDTGSGPEDERPRPGARPQPSPGAAGASALADPDVGDGRDTVRLHARGLIGHECLRRGWARPVAAARDVRAGSPAG